VPPGSAVCTALLLLCAAAIRPAFGVTVEAKVSAREAMPGEAIDLHVVIEGATQAGTPVMPSTPDFSIELRTPRPQVSSFTQIINGRITSSQTATYIYQLRPRRMGQLTVPAFSVEVGGKTYQTQPITVSVVKSDTGDLLYVEFVSSRKSAYVEQPFDLTLRIWLRPFRQGGLTLNANQMWGLLRGESDFGPFARQAAANDFSCRSAMRKDDQGQEREYYLYESTQQVSPDKPGPYQPEGVTISLNYPVRLQQDFFGELRMAQSRRVVEQARPPQIVIRPIPEQGRPDAYNGAIGRFTWKVWADRTDVNRGQLITLNMEIAGKGRLDRVPAPPLAKLPELTRSFKVLDEQLAGEIKEGKKQFRQQIRAIDEKAKAIPPIPFVFFDPDADGGQGKFVTLLSETIPIAVHAAASLSASEIQMPAGAAQVRSSLLTEAADSIRANYAESEQVLASQAFSPGVGYATAIAFPPLVWVVAWSVRRHSSRLQADVAFARRRRARRTAEVKLGRAKGSPDAAAHAADALLTYVADRANLPPGGMTRADAVGQLRRDGLPAEVIGELDEVLAGCEAARYARMAGGTDEMIERARRCVHTLERVWKK
jgi:hypothetical protein